MVRIGAAGLRRSCGGAGRRGGHGCDEDVGPGDGDRDAAVAVGGRGEDGATVVPGQGNVGGVDAVADRQDAGGIGRLAGRDEADVPQVQGSLARS